METLTPLQSNGDKYANTAITHITASGFYCNDKAIALVMQLSFDIHVSLLPNKNTCQVTVIYYNRENKSQETFYT